MGRNAKKSKTGKRDKKLSLGLSLMESFAAKNVTKGRLTVRSSLKSSLLQSHETYLA
jgi:hypothetical protein